MIRIQDLSFGYGKQPVLQNITTEMGDGRITAIVGPNGAGKSTLLRLCARLENPWKGNVSIAGKPVQSYETKAFARALSYLPQSRPLPSIPVRTLVMHGRFSRLGPARRPSVQDERAVDRALELTGLASLQHRELSCLSGGQRQKAYLAMSIAQEAQHLLLDEPLTHLDVGCQLELLEILSRLRHEGRCIVMVLHDLALLPKACTQVLLLHEGGVAFEGNVQSLFESGMIERAFGVKAVHSGGLSFEKL